MRINLEIKDIVQNSSLFCQEELNGIVWPLNEVNGNIVGHQRKILTARDLAVKFGPVQKHSPSFKEW